MYAEGGYLRVLVPRTENGVNPVQDENGQAQYKEVHLPVTAKEELEKYNKKLPNHLKRKIEVIPPAKKVQQQQSQPSPEPPKENTPPIKEPAAANTQKEQAPAPAAAQQPASQQAKAQ